MLKDIGFPKINQRECKDKSDINKISDKYNYINLYKNNGYIYEMVK